MNAPVRPVVRALFPPCRGAPAGRIVVEVMPKPRFLTPRQGRRQNLPLSSVHRCVRQNSRRFRADRGRPPSRRGAPGRRPQADTLLSNPIHEDVVSVTMTREALSREWVSFLRIGVIIPSPGFPRRRHIRPMPCANGTEPVNCGTRTPTCTGSTLLSCPETLRRLPALAFHRRFAPVMEVVAAAALCCGHRHLRQLQILAGPTSCPGALRCTTRSATSSVGEQRLRVICMYGMAGRPGPGPNRFWMEIVVPMKNGGGNFIAAPEGSIARGGDCRLALPLCGQPQHRPARHRRCAQRAR